MSESILILSQVLSMYILMKVEKLQSGVSKIINISKSLKLICMYGSILILIILSKL